MKQQLPVRVFVDAHVFDNEFQGTRTFLREIYALIAQKENIRLYLAAYDTDNLQRAFPGLPDIVFLKYRSRSSWYRLLFDIPYLIRKHRIDYAHFQYISPPLKNCRQIVTVHDVIFKDYPEEFSWIYRNGKKALFGFSARRADIITTVSAYSKESIVRYLRTGNRPVYVIPNGVHPRFFQPYDKQKATEYIRKTYGIGKYILYVSRFEPRKNHAFLLKAWLELELFRQGYHLVLLGHKSISVPQFDQLLDSLPPDIRSFIFISSVVKDEDLLEFYRAAAVFAYPSRGEGFGIPPLEAAALKIPVICSSSSAMQDFTFFGDNHIDPYDQKALQQRLAALLAHPPGEEPLQEIAGIVRRRYTWQRSADELYNLIISRPDPGHR